MNRRRPRQRGFTLIELLTVMTVIGILAGIAIPHFRDAVGRAQAARVLGDVNTIRLAAHDYLAETGRFPGAGGMGRMPTEMEDALPDGFPFAYEDVTYTWLSLRLWGTSIWGRELGIVWVRYPSGSPLAKALRANRGDNAIWTPSQMLFLVTH